MKVDAFVKQIEEYTKALVQSVRILDERRYILEPLLLNDVVKTALSNKFENTFGAHAYNHLAPLMGQDILRDISRVFLDQDKRSASFVNLYRKASENQVHTALRDKFRRIPDKWNENPVVPGLSPEHAAEIIVAWQDRDRDDFEVSFNEGWESVSHAIEQLNIDPVTEKIKTFRDKYIAHLEMTPLGQDPGPFDVTSLKLTFDDIFEFLDTYMPEVFELVRVLTGSVHDVDDFSRIHKRYGLDMWCVLSGTDFEVASRA